MPATPDLSVKQCESRCGASSAQTLNRTCYCLSLDTEALRRSLQADLSARGGGEALLESHPHLFASVPLFLSRSQVEQMARVVDAVDKVTASSAFQQATLAWAPEIARFDPGTQGGLLGYDFHLTDEGSQLIEINTNPGGALLNTVLGRAQRACCADVTDLAMVPAEPDAVEAELFQVFATEWRQRRGSAQLECVAIVDEAPEQQYLYPEFLLFQQLFMRHGVAALVCAPADLERRDGKLWYQNRRIDFVYNRVTDFALDLPAQAALKESYLAGEVVVSPHPRAHALYADKRNLALLCDEAFLQTTGASTEAIATLLAGVPKTELVSDNNREQYWTDRRRFFFKPAAGYGSKAAYRGDKLTKRVWESISAGTYVAQALVAPSERNVIDAESPIALKVDIRNYAYQGAVKLMAARLYQGQTTNFRTPHGGFAPVFTSRT